MRVSEGAVRKDSQEEGERKGGGRTWYKEQPEGKKRQSKVSGANEQGKHGHGRGKAKVDCGSWPTTTGVELGGVPRCEGTRAGGRRQRAGQGGRRIMDALLQLGADGRAVPASGCTLHTAHQTAHSTAHPWTHTRIAPVDVARAHSATLLHCACTPRSRIGPNRVNWWDEDAPALVDMATCRLPAPREPPQLKHSEDNLLARNETLPSPSSSRPLVRHPLWHFLPLTCCAVLKMVPHPVPGPVPDMHRNACLNLDTTRTLSSVSLSDQPRINPASVRCRREA